jgi:hypothetical protein
MRRQQTVQMEGVALSFGERRALVQQGPVQEIDPREVDFDNIV